jgi:hypothetical protein
MRRKKLSVNDISFFTCQATFLLNFHGTKDFGFRFMECYEITTAIGYVPLSNICVLSIVPKGKSFILYAFFVIYSFTDLMNLI